MMMRNMHHAPHKNLPIPSQRKSDLHVIRVPLWELIPKANLNVATLPPVFEFVNLHYTRALEEYLLCLANPGPDFGLTNDLGALTCIL